MNDFKFPNDFLFGVATSSYQIEGNRENLDSCIWDDYCKIKGNIADQSDGMIACDALNHLDEDIDLLKKLNVNSYRFSISWTRIIENGIGKIKKDGIEYYKKLIKKLKENNIKPFVTLYHWDLPSVLQEKGGWANKECIDWYLYYVKVIFEEFKEEIPYYVTINEPFCVSFLGYGYACHAPGISNLQKQIDSSLNLLLASAKAVELYKSLGYKGKIGICLNFNDARPLTKDAYDTVEYNKLISTWWFLYPIAYGKINEQALEYFKSKNVQINISDDELKLIHNHGDFIGLNHYSVEYYDKENHYIIRNEMFRNSLGWHCDGTSLLCVLREIHAMINKDIYVLENGFATSKNTLQEELEDDDRIKYLSEYIDNLKEALKENIPVKSYFIWSFMDNFEWAQGYTKGRFGLVYVDFDDVNRKRTPKKSYYYVSNLFKKYQDENIIFYEDFKNNKLDENIWKIETGGFGFGNDEDQYYLKENIVIENNILKIIAKKQNCQNKKYTSSKIVSKKSFMYGHFEILAKIPDAIGSWPAIWLLAEDKTGGWPYCGEIDIMENVGRKKDLIHFSLHSKKYNHKINTQRTKTAIIENATSSYKLYELIWDEKHIEFLVDGITYASYNKDDKKYDSDIESWPFDKPYNLIINMAIGGYFGRPIDDNAFPYEFDIKYIKISR